MNKFDKETFHFIFVLITSVVLFVILLHLIGCSSIPI